MTIASVIQPWEEIVKPPHGTPFTCDHPRLRGCELWLPFLEFQGQGGVEVVRDYSGKGNWCLVYALDGSEWEHTRYGFGPHFGSTDKYYTINSATHGVGTGDFTFAEFFYLHTTTGVYRRFMANGSVAPGIYTRLNTAPWGVYWGADYTSNITLVADTWYSLVVVRRDGVISFYTNGIASTTTHNLATSMPDGVFVIGNVTSPSTRLVDQTVMDARIYSRAWSDAEILDYYTNPWAEFETQRVWSIPAGVVANPKGPLRMPLYGPFGGPI